MVDPFEAIMAYRRFLYSLMYILDDDLAPFKNGWEPNIIPVDVEGGGLLLIMNPCLWSEVKRVLLSHGVYTIPFMEGS
jgi:hypothetical protein